MRRRSARAHRRTRARVDAMLDEAEQTGAGCRRSSDRSRARCDRRRGRALGLGQVLAQRVAEADQARGGAQRVAIRGALEQIGHLGPAPGRGVEIGQRVDGLGVLAAVADDPEPRADRGVVVVQVIALHRRDADQIRSLLHRRDVLLGAQIERRDQIGPPARALEQRDPRVERRQVAGVVDRCDAPTAPVRDRCRRATRRGARPRPASLRRALASLSRSACRSSTARRSLGRFVCGRRARRAGARPRAARSPPAPLMPRASTRQLDRAVDIVRAVEARARGLREQLDLARGILGLARGIRDALGVAIVKTAAIGELAQLLLGDAATRAAARAALRSDPSRRGRHRPRPGAHRPPRAADLAVRGIDLDDALQDADHFARLLRGRVVVRCAADRARDRVPAWPPELSASMIRSSSAAGLLVVVGLGEQRPCRRQRARRISAQVVEPAPPRSGRGCVRADSSTANRCGSPIAR